MKGVIVQVGNPKSIVLLNNGKISAIPTPTECHVGMVVTIKLNNKPKIIAIALLAIFLLAIGTGIGIFVSHSSHKANPKNQQEKQYSQENFSFQKGKQENGNGE